MNLGSFKLISSVLSQEDWFYYDLHHFRCNSPSYQENYDYSQIDSNPTV